MRTSIKRYIKAAYAGGKLADSEGEGVRRQVPLESALRIFDKLRELEGVEPENWHPDDENMRSLQIMVYAPSETYWNDRFHSQSHEARTAVINEHGGKYCNMRIRMSNLAPVYTRGWTCWTLEKGKKIKGEYAGEPPDEFWSQIDNHVSSIMVANGYEFITYEEAQEQVPWMELAEGLPAEIEQPVTVFTCFFEAF